MARLIISDGTSKHEVELVDALVGPAKQLQNKLSGPDRERLDQYFSAVRDVEKRLTSNQEWARRPRPMVNYAPPRDVANPNDDLTRLTLMLDKNTRMYQE